MDNMPCVEDLRISSGTTDWISGPLHILVARYFLYRGMRPVIDFAWGAIKEEFQISLGLPGSNQPISLIRLELGASESVQIAKGPINVKGLQSIRLLVFK